MNIEKIKFIHEYLVEYFLDKEDPVSPPGIKNEALLESAVNRPFMSAGGKDAYVGVFNKSAALFHSVINNHCFHNGNKRAALLSTLVFLSENGYALSEPSDGELFEFTRKAAAHELCENRDDELSYITDWLQRKCRHRGNREQTVKLHELRKILAGFNFELGEVDGRTINVIQDGHIKAKILQKGGKGKEDYYKKHISQLRKKLQLTPAYGIDSFKFYGERGFSNTLNYFMKMRDKVMRELAKT